MSISNFRQCKDIITLSLCPIRSTTVLSTVLQCTVHLMCCGLPRSTAKDALNLAKLRKVADKFRCFRQICSKVAEALSKLFQKMTSKVHFRCLLLSVYYQVLSYAVNNDADRLATLGFQVNNIFHRLCSRNKQAPIEQKDLRFNK